MKRWKFLGLAAVIVFARCASQMPSHPLPCGLLWAHCAPLPPPTPAPEAPPTEPPQPVHVDPSSIPLTELARIRGDMWPIFPEWHGPYGPRPGQPGNVFASESLQCYSDAERDEAIGLYRDTYHYTHIVDSPAFEDVPPGYHGQWCPSPNVTQDFEAYLDRLQWYWDQHLTPVTFIHPDNWTYEQTIALTPLFQSERAQRLMRIVVPTGWEPTRYGWSSCTWAAYGKWARETWPNALILFHTVQDVDAPTGVDDRCNDDQNPDGKVTTWNRVAPYFHGWLTQLGYYPHGDGDLSMEQARQRFADMFRSSNRSGYQGHFDAGIWPRISAWGPGKRLLIYNGEAQAYYDYWFSQPGDYSTALSWGDAAMAAGADGFLNGGSVDVQVPVTLR